jgi:hypothetical protein
MRALACYTFKEVTTSLAMNPSSLLVSEVVE